MKIKTLFQPLYSWLILVILIFIEYLYFRNYISRELIHYYPTYFDQSSYLLNCYRDYQTILNHGFIYFLQHGYGRSAASSLFTIQTLAAFFLFGASRITALTINFVFFSILQIVSFKVAKDLTGKYLFSFLFLGLLLLAQAPYFWAGGIFDFRIDFPAYCLFGILIGCILKSDIFLNRKWALISAFTAVYLILLRHITATYLCGILFFVLSYLILRRSRDQNHYTRFKNIILFSAIIFVCIFPFLWLAKEDLYNYYIVGHLINEERLMRAMQAGVTDFSSNILFYPTSLFKDHIGRFESYILLILIFSVRFISKKPFHLNNINTFFLILCVVIPFLILTLDTSKSLVVANIMVTPTLWLAWWLTYSSYKANDKNNLLTFFITFSTVLIVCLGLKNYIVEMKHQSYKQHKNDMMEITRMYNDIGNHLKSKKLENVRFSTDHIADYLTHANLNILYYETHKIMLNAFTTILGAHNMHRITEKEALDELKRTDVLVINKGPYQISADDYPFNIAVEKIRPVLLKNAPKNLKVLGDYTFKNYHYRVYVK